MAISYEHHMFNGTDAYLPHTNGRTGQIRIKKIDGTKELAILDHVMRISELETITELQLKQILDKMITDDENRDIAKTARINQNKPAIDPAIDAKLKRITLKTRTAGGVPEESL